MIREINDNSGKITSGNNLPFWLDHSEPLKFEDLKEDISVDAAIIGGGIAGITTAYLLSKQGLKIAVIEDGYIASGETGRTTAHLVNVLDDRYTELQNLFGKDNAKLAAESHTQAVNKIEEIINTENIECDFERLNGFLFLHDKDEKTNFEDELKAALESGVSVEIVNSAPGIKNTGKTILKFSNQAQFHPVKYLKALCKAIIKNGGRIFTQTKAEDVSTEGVKIKNGNFIKAAHIVVATNTPFVNRFIMHTKQTPYRTYVIGAKIKKDSIEKALWWDTGDHNSKWPSHPYHYVRLHKYNDQFDLLISGGEDHKTGQADEEGIPEADRYEVLKVWTKKHFPEIGEIVYHWSGQVIEPIDSLAFIGRNPLDKDNIYIATGDSGNGMTHGTIAGILITDLIMGRKNKWEDIYDPSRKTLKAADVFIEGQTNVVKQYFDFLKDDESYSFKGLSKEEGAVINKEGTKAAVYKDKNGKIYFFSAVCPHLKCIIQWNNSEKTFDCPCHGSRFTCLGKVINGPANSDLERIQLEK